MNKRSHARKRAEWLRAYHSEARVEWMRQQPCSGCGRGPCETHHITTGGVGRKADYHLTIPLCAGCHRAWHQLGWVTVCREWDLNPLTEARRIQALWRETLDGLEH